MFNQLNSLLKKIFSNEETIIFSLVLVFVLLIISFFGSILTPFLISIVVAYLLVGLQKKIESYNVSKYLALLITFSIFIITGAARRDIGVKAWKESLGNYPEEFMNILDYVSCDLSNQESLNHLPETDDTTYFLSVPPERYEWAIINLKQGGFLDDPETSRVVIEKPFGYDLKSANHLQSVVGRHLREKQVYRIDHYLGKDTVNNILTTRFGNILLEPLWNREYIEEVQIYATETIGCEGRSQYYEGAGVVRDMLQNHMLLYPSKEKEKEIRHMVNF